MNPGIAYAALAYVIWGLFPLYFAQLASIPALEVLAHRIVWSLVFMAGVLAVKRHWAWLAQAFRQPRTLKIFAASALLLSANWLTYVWAVTHGHVVDSSLGYFITPLVNVLLGYTVLHERLRPVQWLSVGIAAAGVLWLAVQGGQFPWIALVLACTFGGYGLLRKTAPLGALEGLALETVILAVPAFAVLFIGAAQGVANFPSESSLVNLMLVGIGPVTAIPLLLFASGARRIPLSTLGLLQYLAPSIQFMLGIWLFREPFSGARMVGFCLIWLALAIYSIEGLHRGATSRAPVLEPD